MSSENLPQFPKFLKRCPSCGWEGVTGLAGCYRRWDHVGGGFVFLVVVNEEKQQ